MKTEKDKIELLYTPLIEAAEELRQRRQNIELCEAIARFQKDHLPAFINVEPFLALVRGIITADDELECLLQMSQSVSLAPLCIEYSIDRFVTLNPDKLSLCKLSFRIRKQEVKLRIIDFLKYDGKSFSDIRTHAGQRLSDFHHRLIEYVYPNKKIEFVDFSDWVMSFGCAHLDYLPYLALFVTQGILLENFIAGDELERKFTEERVIPAFEKITAMFGVKPLIVRAYNADEELNPDHWYYAESLYPFAKKLLDDPEVCKK